MANKLKGLRYRRRMNEHTMEDAARVIDRSASHYSKIERGVAPMTLEQARMLAQWLECSIDELL